MIELSSDSDDDNNENLQSQPLHMPKLSAFGDTNKSLNAFSQFGNPSTLNSLCSQIPSGLDSRAHSRNHNLITRYFQKVDKKSNLEK